MAVFKLQLILLLAIGLLHQGTAAPIAVADGLDRFDATLASSLVKRVEEDPNKGQDKGKGRARVVSPSSYIPPENYGTLLSTSQEVDRQNAAREAAAAAAEAAQARQREAQQAQQPRQGRKMPTLQPEGGRSAGGGGGGGGGGGQRRPSDTLPINAAEPSPDQLNRMFSPNHPEQYGAIPYREGPLDRSASTRAQAGNSPPRGQSQSSQGQGFSGAIRPNPNHPLPPLPEEAQPKPLSRSQTSSPSPTRDQQPRPLSRAQTAPITPQLTAANLQTLGGGGGGGRTSSQGSAGTTGAVHDVPTNRQGQANAASGLVRSDSQRSAGTTGAVRNVPTNQAGQANARNAQQSSSGGRVRTEASRINAKVAADKAAADKTKKQGKGPKR
ncbi:hypothetical protein PpBr36_05517 [Pyricularia pennisetigena]|uniref:hypothetical protein n=1 Tax=Pyricularia pennisetigena TaxID=1578925 RepID=UPI00114DB0F6|nr:hypothetical protein PpBr36_05517 [Pyricularia pennisetigena]TLS26462.1 hypothetical protein PpBr36_05517 [Pyricularia pennisetigena]